MIINKLDIREQNEATVLKAIIENKNISRANISTLTNLNKASVSQIIKNLIENDIVEEVGIGNASSMGGRKPIQLHFNGRCGLALAFDVCPGLQQDDTDCRYAGKSPAGAEPDGFHPGRIRRLLV